MVKVEFKKLYEDSILPKKAHESDAGFDLYAHSSSLFYYNTSDEFEGCYLKPGEITLIKCGFGMALPVGYEGQVRPRSGLALKHGISVVNSPGTIDADYRGEVKVILINLGQESFCIRGGDRIAQMVVAKTQQLTIELCDVLPTTDRGAGGFGSTGVS